MNPAQHIAAQESGISPSTSKIESVKESRRRRQFIVKNLRNRLDQGQVKHLEMLPNDGISKGHATMCHENIWMKGNGCRKCRGVWKTGEVTAIGFGEGGG